MSFNDWKGGAIIAHSLYLALFHPWKWFSDEFQLQYILNFDSATNNKFVIVIAKQCVNISKIRSFERSSFMCHEGLFTNRNKKKEIRKIGVTQIAYIPVYGLYLNVSNPKIYRLLSFGPQNEFYSWKNNMKPHFHRKRKSINYLRQETMGVKFEICILELRCQSPRWEIVWIWYNLDPHKVWSRNSIGNDKRSYWNDINLNY